jgi:hypothetical protein
MCLGRYEKARKKPLKYKKTSTLKHKAGLLEMKRRNIRII